MGEVQRGFTNDLQTGNGAPGNGNLSKRRELLEAFRNAVIGIYLILEVILTQLSNYDS